jgi:glutathione S-transferase
MVLHGGPLSPFVRKVGICIIEKGLVSRFQFVRSVTAIAQPNIELLAYNPLSKIPTLLTDDGQAMFDSDVICEYLDCAISPPSLIPTVGPARWQVLRWNALGSGTLDALVLWRFERNRPVPQQSAQVLQAYAVKIAAVLARAEAEMPAVVAQPFGLGHVAFGCMFGYLDFRFSDLDWRSAHPSCAAFFADFRQRPSALNTEPYESGHTLNLADHLWPPVG